MPKTTGRWTCWMLHASSHKSWKLKTWLPGDVPLSIGPWQPERVPRKTMSLFLRLQGASVANGRSEVKTGLQCRGGGLSWIQWHFLEHQKTFPEKEKLNTCVICIIRIIVYCIIIYVDHYILFLFIIIAIFTMVVIFISSINITIIYEWKSNTYTIYYHTYIDYDHIYM